MSKYDFYFECVVDAIIVVACLYAIVVSLVSLLSL